MAKNVVVTGGSSGIGAAIIARLLDADCRVWNLDVVDDAVDGVTSLHCDLSDPLEVADAVAELPDRVDAFVSAVGIAPGVAPESQIVSVNFLGVRLMVERLLPKVVDSGSLVIVASSAGRDWRDNQSTVDALLDTADYSAGMDWLNANPSLWQDDPYKFSKQCAAAYTYRAVGLGRARKVRVNCINPGIVETRLSPAFRSMLGGEKFDNIVSASGRAGQPDDIAAIAQFLLVGDCSWLNGVEITVDGGYHAGIIGGWITPP